MDRGVLGLDGDALLALEVHRVHGAFGDGLVFTVSAAGLKELVDEGGLAVVNVGNDGEVADIEGHGIKGGLAAGRGAMPRFHARGKAGMRSICCKFT